MRFVIPVIIVVAVSQSRTCVLLLLVIIEIRYYKICLRDGLDVAGIVVRAFETAEYYQCRPCACSGFRVLVDVIFRFDKLNKLPIKRPFALHENCASRLRVCVHKSRGRPAVWRPLE